MSAPFVEALYDRRAIIRKLIGELRSSSRNRFPNWKDSPPRIDVPAVKCMTKVLRFGRMGSLMDLFIIAGPNGAGKTTFAREFLPNYADCKNFVNADLIAQGMAPFSPETAAFRAEKMIRPLQHSSGMFTFPAVAEWRRNASTGGSMESRRSPHTRGSRPRVGRTDRPVFVRRGPFSANPRAVEMDDSIEECLFLMK